MAGKDKPADPAPATPPAIHAGGYILTPDGWVLADPPEAAE